jgi:hypothetical protein
VKNEDLTTKTLIHLKLQNIQNADPDLFHRHLMKLGAKLLFLGEKVCVLLISLLYQVFFGDEPQ